MGLNRVTHPVYLYVFIIQIFLCSDCNEDLLPMELGSYLGDTEVTCMDYREPEHDGSLFITGTLLTLTCLGITNSSDLFTCLSSKTYQSKHFMLLYNASTTN